MRVLTVVGELPSAANPSRGIFVQRQVESLRALGLDVDVWVPSGRPRALGYLLGMLQVSRKVRRGAYDLIHAHYALSGVVARAQWHVPVVVSYMGSDVLSARGTGSVRGTVDPWIGRLLAAVVDAAIVKSDEMRGVLGRRRPVYVIPNGVDFDVFRPTDRADARRQLGLAPDRRYVAFVSDPARMEKDFALAQAALGLAASRVPDVEMLVVSKQPTERVVLALNAADALILTSRYEGSPNVVKEAMACNLPVVSVDVGDVRKIIGGTDGCFVCDHDPAELADRLVTVLARNERTDGRSAIRHLSLAAVAEQVASVYRGVLKPKK